MDGTQHMKHDKVRVSKYPNKGFRLKGELTGKSSWKRWDS